MHMSQRQKVPTAAKTVLWSARLLTIAILCFWGFFIVAHLIGDAGASTRPLKFHDYASLGFMVASLVGLGLALKRERLGSTVALIAVLIGAVFNRRILLFPAALIPMAAVLFLIHSRLWRGER